MGNTIQSLDTHTGPSSSLLDGLSNLGSFIARSAGRVRLNSNLPGCSSPSHGRSPSRGTCSSPSRAQASPSRPTSAANSIGEAALALHYVLHWIFSGRGRRSMPWNKNAQKYLDFDSRPLTSTDNFSKMANDRTPGKAKTRAPGCSTAQSDSGDTSASETGQEVASFLNNFPGNLDPGKPDQDDSFAVHVLTEDPDDNLNTEFEEEVVEEIANEEEIEVVERKSSRVASVSDVKDFSRLQAEEFEKTIIRAREKDPLGERGKVYQMLWHILNCLSLSSSPLCGRRHH